MPKELKSYRSRLLNRLTIPSEAAAYVNAALEDSNEMFLEALKDVAQAHQMATVAKKSGVARENLYRAFSVEGNPILDTLQSVLPTLGLKLAVTIQELREYLDKRIDHWTPYRPGLDSDSAVKIREELQAIRARFAEELKP